MQDHIIIARDVWLTFGRGATEVSVLRGADLTVDTGCTLAITGPSGSGKSTMLMVLGGLERADRGEVMVAGQDMMALSEDELTAFRGRQLGIVFQSFHLIPTMTALENVAVPLEIGKVANARDMARAELAAVGLSDRANHYPAELSGGEQQRVAIARALAPRPSLLLADEPTGNLDEETGNEIADLMFAAARERKQTMILVTHDLELARRCDSVLRVSDGRLHEASETGVAA
ncbi:MAG: ABC transporter ATP-binding protein [Pseudomonadota bacterium]